MTLRSHLESVHGFDTTAAADDAVLLLHARDHATSRPGRPFEAHDHMETAMPKPARPLDVARRDLDRRAQAADAAGDWRESCILFPLATVADMVCRIGDHSHSAHYRADKSGELVTAALRVQLECVRGYAVDEAAGLDAAAEVLVDVAAVVRMGMWVIARRANGSGAEVYASDVRRIRDAQAAFGAWADTICAGAVPDPVE